MSFYEEVVRITEEIDTFATEKEKIKNAITREANRGLSKTKVYVDCLEHVQKIKSWLKRQKFEVEELESKLYCSLLISWNNKKDQK